MLYVPELLRIKGETLLRLGTDQSSIPAEDCFRQATEMARQQGTLLWELRIALSRAQLRVAQGRGNVARDILLPVFERFPEGFGTADLRAAKALLDKLPG
jgi:predicted ATPase